MVEDPAAPGHYTTIVANCDYIRWNSYEPPKAIKVYYGENSWSDSGRWDQINAEDEIVGRWEEDTIDPT